MTVNIARERAVRAFVARVLANKEYVLTNAMMNEQVVHAYLHSYLQVVSHKIKYNIIFKHQQWYNCSSFFLLSFDPSQPPIKALIKSRLVVFKMILINTSIINTTEGAGHAPVLTR